MALDWQVIQIPLAAGLNQRPDTRALNPPGLDICRDVQFDEEGGLQTRKPFDTDPMGDIFGGSLVGDARRIYDNDGEFVMFTKDSLYSRNAQLGEWILKGTHLAVEVTETTKFFTTGDQVCADRAELSGTVVYAWTDNGRVYVAAEDKTTGSVLLEPTGITDTVSASVSERPRLVALSTKILLLYHNGTSGSPGSLRALAIDPADPSADLGTQVDVVADPNFGEFYDAVRIPSADTACVVAARAVTTSYTISKVTAALAVTSSTKARDCDGPIAVSVTPDAASAQVVRQDIGDIVGDLITVSSLADVYTNQAIGTGPLIGPDGVTWQITCAHRSVLDGGYYRCYVFWSGVVSTGAPTDGTQYNWVDSGGTLGTAGVFGSHSTDEELSVGTRAFDHDGSVYLWMVFSGSSEASGTRIQLQNTYFLFRDDAFLVAKAVAGNAAGASAERCHLPGVVSTGTDGHETTYSFCGGERRTIILGGDVDNGYAARAPRNVDFTFDTNRARRCARIGQTLYIACGEGLLAYDGTRLVETGFHVYPWQYAISGDPGTGSIPDGTYAGKHTWRWDNARGELDRSTTATVDEADVSGGPGHINAILRPITATHKAIAGNMPASELWRTPVAPIADSPFYLTTSKDPADTSGANAYLDCTATSTTDELEDEDLAQRETFPENGEVLEYLAPPPCSIVLATDTRLFLAGVAGDPDRVRYSRLRASHEVASFHDGLTIDIPPTGGAITALGFLNETLIVFRESAIYALPGDGLNNLGQGQNYGPARILAADVGAVNHESVALTPMGLVFKSLKGWYLLNRGWSADYIGGQVSDFDDEDVRAVHVLETQHQIRCMLETRIIVLDYSVRSESSPLGQWSEWTQAGIHAAMWGGVYHVLGEDGPIAQRSDFTGINYGMDVETCWIKLSDLQGFGRVRWIQVLGEYRSAHRLEVRIARDYLVDGSEDPDYFDDKLWTVSPTTVGGPLQVRHGPSQQRCQAIKVRLTAVGATDTEGGDPADPSGESLKLTGLALQIGIKPGLYRRLPAAQQQ